MMCLCPPPYSRVNHPYLKQWAKEWSHIGQKEISPYLISALVPISYTPERNNALEQQPVNGVPPQSIHSNGIHNGDEDAHNKEDIVDMTTLQLDPLPRSGNGSSAVETTGDALTDNSPDPSTLQLAPLPPLKPEQQSAAEASKKTSELSTATSDGNSNTVDDKTIRTEVLNNEFGVQELSVFAVEQPRSISAQSTIAKLVSNTPIIAPPLVSNTPIIAPPLTVTTLYPSSTPLTAGPPQALPSMLGSSTPKLSSTMDSVPLKEFTEAFMQGDTTNWYQRMKLLDHIEGVQERVSVCVEAIKIQLEGEYALNS